MLRRGCFPPLTQRTVHAGVRATALTFFFSFFSDNNNSKIFRGFSRSRGSSPPGKATAAVSAEVRCAPRGAPRASGGQCRQRWRARSGGEGAAGAGRGRRGRREGTSSRGDGGTAVTSPRGLYSWGRVRVPRLVPAAVRQRVC